MLSDSASLILSTKSTVNPCTINTEKTAFTFPNIDMKNVMGEMWDKYDQFALKLISFSTEGSVTLPSSADGLITYNLRGLEWSNLIYETTGSINNKEWIPVAYAIVTNATPTINPLITNTGWSFNFKKNSRMVDLEFAIAAASSQFGASQFGVPPAGASYNNVEFHFLFEPVIAGKMNECAFYGFNSTPTLTGLIKRDVPTNRTIYSYPDFSMRRLCDLFWDKHDNFEIQMAMNSLRGTGTVTGDVRIVPVQMSGLNFVNNGTKQSNATSGLMLNSENAILGSLTLPTTGSSFIVDMAYPVAPVQFKKDGDNVPLTITFKNSENTGPTTVSLTGSAPGFQIGFFVKPIYEVEKAQLFINPFGLTTTETNLGVRDTNYTTFTLKNIDLRQVCRSMWDKYDRFNIFLSSVTWHTAVGNATNAAFIIQMEGFDFINQLSLTASNRQTQVATLGSFYASPTPTTDVRTIGTMASCVTTFLKTKDIVDLTLTAIPLGATAFSAMSPFHANFTFTIVGVPKDEEQSKQFTQDLMR
jgi:hypothetical protein